MTVQQPLVPAEGTKDRTPHILLDPDGRWCVAQWRAPTLSAKACWRHFDGGNYSPHLRGWTYIGPVPEPDPSLVADLDWALATSTNDDQSKPMTLERDRMVKRAAIVQRARVALGGPVPEPAMEGGDG